MPSSILASLFLRDMIDVVVGTSPQFFTVCAAYVISRLKGVPFVFELRDIWPDSIIAVGAMRQSLPVRILEKIELFLYRSAALVIALTWAFKENLISRGIPESKICVVPNGVDLNFFQPRKKPVEMVKTLGIEDKKVVSYIGTVGMAHGVDKIVEVARAMHDDKRVFFLIVGDGAEWERIRYLVQSWHLANIAVKPLVPKDEVVYYYALTDIFLVTLRDTALFRTVIPSKIFEAMAMELPIICAVDGQCRAIVEQAQAGIFVKPEDVNGMVEAIKRLLDSPKLAHQMGQNGRSYVTDHFDRNRLAQKMITELEKIAQHKS